MMNILLIPIAICTGPMVSAGIAHAGAWLTMDCDIGVGEGAAVSGCARERVISVGQAEGTCGSVSNGQANDNILNAYWLLT